MKQIKKQKETTTLNTGEEFEHDISIHILWDTDRQQYAIESNLAMDDIVRLLEFMLEDLTEEEMEDEDDKQVVEPTKLSKTPPRNPKVGGTIN